MKRLVIAFVLLAVLTGCTGPPSVRPEPPDASPDASAQPLRPLGAHTATLLADGSVLLAGGCATDGCTTAEAEPSSQLFREGAGFAPGPPMRHPRQGHSATLLADGRVLIVGGWVREGTTPLAEAEVYDPATGTFEAAGSLRLGRGGHSATLLPDGRVLVSGGQVERSSLTATIELYDPRSGTFTPGASMAAPRHAATATPLPDGRVLVAGGQDDSGAGLSSTLLYNPATDAWSAGPELGSPRFKHAAAALGDGRVLVLGGTTDDVELLASTDLLDAGGARFDPGPAMDRERYKFTDAVALTGAGLVVAGGTTVELLADGTASFVTLDVPAGPWRSSASATALSSGDVLVVGGYDERIRLHADAFVVQPSV